MLERHDGELLTSVQKLFGPVAGDSIFQFVKFVVYLSSNNLLPANHTDDFLKWIINNKQLSTLKSFLMIKESTVEAFAASIFLSALRLEDAGVVKMLLGVGIDPIMSDQEGYTPLQIVSRRG